MSDVRGFIRRLGLWGGPTLAVLVYAFIPREYAGTEGETVIFATAGRDLGGHVLDGVWWLTETVELSTALLPLVMPILGAVSITDAAAPYAHRLIFLFMGGFMIALSMQRWGLDKRIALATLRLVGTKPANMIAGFMGTATAFLSAFISNTATTAMMLPIAVSVVALLKEKAPGQGKDFGVALMLAIAYSASMGGLSTLVGAPPNAFLASFVADNIAEPYRMEISFAKWLMFGVPVALCMLPVIWLLLTKWLYPTPTMRIEGGASFIQDVLSHWGR